MDKSYQRVIPYSMRSEDGSLNHLRRYLSITSNSALSASLTIYIMAVAFCRLEQHGQVTRIPVVGFETHVGRRDSRADMAGIYT